MSMSTLSTVQLRCFVRIVETGSFAKTGRELGLSTSAVSKTMSRLEEAAGVRLLNRSTHSLSLTPEGEELIAPAREAVVDAALGAAARLGVGGRVRLGAPTALPVLGLGLLLLLPGPSLLAGRNSSALTKAQPGRRCRPRSRESRSHRASYAGILQGGRWK
jgi:hypothetical protein